VWENKCHHPVEGITHIIPEQENSAAKNQL